MRIYKTTNLFSTAVDETLIPEDNCEFPSIKTMPYRKIEILNLSYATNQHVSQESAKGTLSSGVFFPHSAFVLPLLLYNAHLYFLKPSLSSLAPAWFTRGEHLPLLWRWACGAGLGMSL